MAGLTVDRIDPVAETRRYIDKVMTTRGRGLDEQGKALLLEDLASPCTEEVAVFHAFSRIVVEARSAFVVLDTAPTGHTLLLMDAAGAYHRQMVQQLDPSSPGRIVTPLMRLQDPDYTRIILSTKKGLSVRRKARVRSIYSVPMSAKAAVSRWISWKTCRPERFAIRPGGPKVAA